MRSIKGAVLIWSLVLVLFCCPSLYSAKPHNVLHDLNHSKKSPASSNPSVPNIPSEDARFSEYTMEAAVIRPYRQAVVSSEVSGVINELHVREGDPVVGGQVILEISRDLFKLAAERAQERLAGLEAVLKQTESDLEIQEYLFSHNATTKSQLVKARAESEIARHKLNEAKVDLALALRDLENCRVKAPFSGHIITLYKVQYESAQRFDQLFLLADTSKVYAVVNVPEQFLSRIRKGTAAMFLRPEGARYPGTVAKISKPIDPSSKTKKVHVLIDNSAATLEMGMLGSVQLITKR